jgi:hypothetical protein
VSVFPVWFIAKSHLDARILDAYMSRRLVRGGQAQVMLLALAAKEKTPESALLSGVFLQRVIVYDQAPGA